ncbi:MAG: class I SAM-dependent methyltransferase [Chitinophagaceae bacterium]
MIKSLKRQFKLMWYKGAKYSCPFCHYSSRSWFVIGYDYPVIKEKKIIPSGRRPGGCYNCRSSDKERLVYMYLKEKTDLLKPRNNISVLHMAPERKLSQALQQLQLKEYVCGDLFADGYHYPDYVQNMNVLHLPFPDNHFDLVICNHVLEHVPEDRAAMKEIARVLKKGGQAIMQVPISHALDATYEDFSITEPHEREKVFGQYDHVRIYAKDYVDRLQESGFEVGRINIGKEFERCGINQHEDIFIIKKV